MAVPTSSVSTFNDAVTDTNLTNNIPLLNKNGTFDGRLAGDTATTVGSDGFDIFVIDVSGGTHDSAGSLTSSDTLTISYQLDGPGSISIGEGLARYSDLNSGLGPSGGGNHSPLSGSGTFTVNASHWT